MLASDNGGGGGGTDGGGKACLCVSVSLPVFVSACASLSAFERACCVWDILVIVAGLAAVALAVVAAEDSLLSNS